MKRALCLAAVGVICLAAPARAELDFDTDFVLNARPASILIEVDSDKFGVTDADSGSRTTISSVYTMPNISAGIGLDFDTFYVDLTGGAGILINDSFRSFILQAGVTAAYRATDSFKIGPRLALVHFPDPDWLEDDQTEFDGTTGYLLGVQAAMGDRISYILSIDLIAADFDVESKAGSVPDEDELELTGLAFQFGVRGEF